MLVHFLRVKRVVEDLMFIQFLCGTESYSLLIFFKHLKINVKSVNTLPDLLASHRKTGREPDTAQEFANP